MPVDNIHYAVNKIEGNPCLQRYISLEKFISMLSRDSLFFTRVDRLEDTFEGTSPKIVRMGLQSFFEQRKKEGLIKVPITKEFIEQQISIHEEHAEKMRALYTVSCWHARKVENALMWRSYAANNSGIMIKSDYKRIVKALETAENSIQTSTIKYADYDEDSSIRFGNGIHPIIYKRLFFSDETEIRLIHQVSNKMWVHDWSKEESEDGVYIKINVEHLIEEIRIAPFAPKWYLDVVISVCEKYGVSAPVLMSSLA